MSWFVAAATCLEYQCYYKVLELQVQSKLIQELQELNKWYERSNYIFITSQMQVTFFSFWKTYSIFIVIGNKLCNMIGSI